MPHESPFAGSPIGKTRLVYSIILTVPAGIFMYLASTNLHWFTFTRLGYLVFGIAAGLLAGFFEAKQVTSKLSKETESFVWQAALFSTLLLAVPFIVAVAVFGTSEYAPFGLFTFFPFIAAQLAISGYYINRFDKENEVLTYASFYTFKYWIQPNPNSDDRLQYFLQDVALKDTNLLWANVGYAGGYLRKLQKEPLGDTQTQNALINLLKLMKRSGRRVLIHFGLILPLEAVIFALIFGFPDSYIGPYNSMTVLMPLMLFLWVTLGANLLITMRLLKRNGAKIIQTIDTQNLRLTESA